MKRDFCANKIQELKENYPFLRDLNTQEQVKLFIENNEDKIKQIKESKKSYIKIDGKYRYILSVKLKITELKEQIQIAYIYQRYLRKNAHIKIKEGTTLEKIELTKKQYEYLQDIIENKEIRANFEDLRKIYTYILENDIENKYEILERIIKHTIYNNEESLKESRRLALNCFKQKTIYYLCQIKDEQERKIIKRKLMQPLDNNKELKELEQKYDPIYDILNFWICEGDSDSYYYLKRLFEIEPEFLNIKNPEGNHLIFTVLDKTFKSCLKELQNQLKENSYVHKEYFLSILKLIIDNPNLKLSEEEKVKFEQEIEDFIKLIIDKKYKKGPEIIRSLNNFRKEEKEEENKMPKDIYNFKYIYDFLIQKDDRHDMTDLYTVVFSNKEDMYYNRAYSFEVDDKGKIVFHIHTVDVSSYIIEDSTVDNYLKHQMFEKNGFIPKEVAIKSMSLIPNVKRPTLTYSITIDGNGKVLSHDIYESYITVDEVRPYKDLRLDELKQDENLQLMAYLFYYLLNDNEIVEYKKDDIGDTMKKMLFSITSRVVGRYFEKREYPFIYRVHQDQDSEQFCYHMTQLNYLMGKIPVEDAKKVYQVICEDHNYAFYNDKNIGHAFSKQDFYVDLFNPMDSYVTVTLQRLIKQYYIRKQDDEYMRNQVQEIIKLANLRKQQIREKQKTLG